MFHDPSTATMRGRRKQAAYNFMMQPRVTRAGDLPGRDPAPVKADPNVPHVYKKDEPANAKVTDKMGEVIKIQFTNANNRPTWLNRPARITQEVIVPEGFKVKVLPAGKARGLRAQTVR